MWVPYPQQIHNLFHMPRFCLRFRPVQLLIFLFLPTVVVVGLSSVLLPPNVIVKSIPESIFQEMLAASVRLTSAIAFQIVLTFGNAESLLFDKYSAKVAGFPVLPVGTSWTSRSSRSSISNWSNGTGKCDPLCRQIPNR